MGDIQSLLFRGFLELVHDLPGQSCLEDPLDVPLDWDVSLNGLAFELHFQRGRDIDLELALRLRAPSSLGFGHDFV